MTVFEPDVKANGLYLPWGKKWTLTCGRCVHTWRTKRLPINEPQSAVCPCCGAQNMWSVVEFEEDYKDVRGIQ